MFWLKGKKVGKVVQKNNTSIKKQLTEKIKNLSGTFSEPQQGQEAVAGKARKKELIYEVPNHTVDCQFLERETLAVLQTGTGTVETWMP